MCHLNQTRHAFFCMSPMFQAYAEAFTCDGMPHMPKPDNTLINGAVV